MDLTEAVLGERSPNQETKGLPNKSGALTFKDAESAHDLILELLEDEALHEALEENNSSAAQKKLHLLCWNEACTLLESDEPSKASRFYALAAAFNPAEDTENALSCRMAIAVCSSSQREYSAALEHLQAAETIAPARLSTAFLRFKTCLASGDEKATGAALESFAELADCDADALRVVCCEALDAGMQNAAQTALVRLLGKIQENGHDSTRELPLGYGSVVFQNLIQLAMNLSQSADKDEDKEIIPASDNPEEAIYNSGMRSRNNNQFSDLVKWFALLVERLRAVGHETFFQNEEGMHRQLEWLQMSAWNAGCDAGKSGNLDDAAALLARCGDLCAAHPSPDAAMLRRGHVRYYFIHDNNIFRKSFKCIGLEMQNIFRFHIAFICYTVVVPALKFLLSL